MGLENCVDFNGSIYCWNPEIEKFCKVTILVLPTENCPPEAIEKIVSKMSKANKKEGNNA